MSRASPAGCKVYVGGLDPEAQEGEVYDIFARAGQIAKVWIARKPAGFGFIEFNEPRDAENAVRTLDGTEIRGKVVRVEISKKPERSDRDTRDPRDRDSRDSSSSSSNYSRGGGPPSGGAPTCYICHQVGHIAAFCPSNAPPSSRSSPPHGSGYPPPGAYPPDPYPPRDYRDRGRSRSPRRSYRERSRERSPRPSSPRGYRDDRDRRDPRDARDRGREGDRDRDRRPPADDRDRYREEDRRPPGENGRDRKRDEGYRGGESRGGGGGGGGYRDGGRSGRESGDAAPPPPPPPPAAEEKDAGDLGDLDAPQ